MTAIREFIKVKNHKVIVNLPNNFDSDEVEVIIMPKAEDKNTFNTLKGIGKIGFTSQSFESDNEDYSTW